MCCVMCSLTVAASVPSCCSCVAARICSTVCASSSVPMQGAFSMISRCTRWHASSSLNLPVRAGRECQTTAVHGGSNNSKCTGDQTTAVHGGSNNSKCKRYLHSQQQEAISTEVSEEVLIAGDGQVPRKTGLRLLLSPLPPSLCYHGLRGAGGASAPLLLAGGAEANDPHTVRPSEAGTLPHPTLPSTPCSHA